jgi:hypothetical protein
VPNLFLNGAKILVKNSGRAKNALKNEGGQNKSIYMNYYVQSVMFYKNICVQNVQNKSCGHLKKAWRAKKYPRALGWAPLL